MAEVKWIKITTDMFDNRKIKHLRRMPDGNNIVLIWVMLLTMAGRCNSGGMIFLTENIPYTTKMLADELEFEESTVQLALVSLEKLGMVHTNGDTFCITNWNEYQNVEGMDRIREQTRNRVAKHRENAKLLSEKSSNATCNATVTQCNATEKELELEKEREFSPSISPSRSIPPTAEDVKAYCDERNIVIDVDRFVDYYAAQGWKLSNGQKMKDWTAAVRNWARHDDGRKAEDSKDAWGYL